MTQSLTVKEIIDTLAEKAKKGQLALLVGIDFPRTLTGLPSAHELAQNLALEIHRPPAHSLAEVAEQTDKSNYKAGFLPNALPPGGEPGQVHRAIAALPVPYLMTAAYDDRLSRALNDAERPHNLLVTDKDLGRRKFNRPDLIKLCGDLSDPTTLVVAENEYGKVLASSQGRKELFGNKWLVRWLKEKTILVVGADPAQEGDFFSYLYWHVLRFMGAFTKKDDLGDFLVWPDPKAAPSFEGNQSLTLVDSKPLAFIDQLSARLAGQTIKLPPDAQMLHLQAIVQLFFQDASNQALKEADVIGQATLARDRRHQLRSIQVNLNLKLAADNDTLESGLDITYEPDYAAPTYFPEQTGVDLTKLSAWAAAAETARNNKAQPSEAEGQEIINFVLPADSKKRRQYERQLFLRRGFSDAFRIVINLFDRRLSSYPWELLHDGHITAIDAEVRGLGFLGLKYPVYRRVGEGADPGRVEARIRRALVFGADPTNKLKEMPAEVAWLADTLRRQAEVEVEVIGPDNDMVNDPEAIKDRIRLGDFQLLHFAGHAQFDANNPEKSKLLLGQPKKPPRSLTAEQLAEVAAESALTFVYISACEGGEQAGETPAPWKEAGIVDALARAGVPATLGMRWRIADPQARKLTETFYDGLLRGKPSEVALMHAREAVAAGPDWANPILTKRNHML